VGYALSWVLANLLSGPWLVFWVGFFRGCSPQACGEVGILLQRLCVGYGSSWSVLGFQSGCCRGLGWFLGAFFQGVRMSVHPTGVALEALEG
jgi:hypothetical protein